MRMAIDLYPGGFVAARCAVSGHFAAGGLMGC
jgi:hypothetical protein